MLNRWLLSNDQKEGSRFQCVEKEFTFQELAEKLHQKVLKKIEGNKLSKLKENYREQNPKQV